MGEEDLQLLRDVITRWSSTLLMIERDIKLKDVCLSVTIAQIFNWSIGN